MSVGESQGRHGGELVRKGRSTMDEGVGVRLTRRVVAPLVDAVECRRLVKFFRSRSILDLEEYGKRMEEDDDEVGVDAFGGSGVNERLAITKDSEEEEEVEDEGDEQQMSDVEEVDDLKGSEGAEISNAARKLRRLVRE